MSKLLLVVDYQKDFVDGALGFKDALRLDPLIAAKIREYHANNQPVICTLDTHSDNYLDTYEGKNLPVPHCIKGSEGFELYGEVRRAASEAHTYYVEKQTFGCKELPEILRAINKDETITEVEVCGVVTNMCVISNAIIAKSELHEAHFRILADMCSSFDMVKHNEALSVMESMQMEIVK